MVTGSSTRTGNAGYPPERALPGIIARLTREDWHEMAAAANASANHVKSLDRWTAKAREANPNLDDGQAERLAVMLRRDHYARMGRLSAKARKLARDAAAELARGDE